MWTVEQVDSDSVENDFERITLDNKLPIGAWPFDCEKIIPCISMPQQTCGCDYYAIDANLGNLSKGIDNKTVRRRGLTRLRPSFTYVLFSVTHFL